MSWGGRELWKIVQILSDLIEANISEMSEIEKNIAKFFIGLAFKEDDLSAENICRLNFVSQSA